MGSKAVGSGMTPYMRMKTRGGDLVAEALLTGKKIAVLGTVEVSDFMQTSGQSPAGLDAGVQQFISIWNVLGGSPEAYDDSTCFKQQVRTMAEYMGWAFMYGMVQQGYEASMPSWPAGATLTYPLADSNDLIGSMECKLVFSGTPSGEISITMTASEDGYGAPKSGSYSGTSTLIIPEGTMLATATMLLEDTGNGPDLTSITITGTTSPDGNIVSTVMLPGGTGTGTLKNSAGTQIGTIEFTSTGGTLYMDTGTSEAFTY